VPHATASARQRSIGSAFSRPTKNPASKASPAPIASTVSTAVAPTRIRRRPRRRCRRSRRPDGDGRAARGEDPDCVIQVVGSGDRARLGPVGQEHVHEREQIEQPAVPGLRGVPVRIERHGATSRTDPFEQVGEVTAEILLQEVRAHVDVPGRRERVGRRVRAPQVRDRAGRGEDRAIALLDKMTVIRSAGSVDPAPRGVHATLGDRIDREPAERVVPDYADERRHGAKARRRTRGDRARSPSTDRDPRGARPGRTPERRRPQHQVGIRIAENQHVEIGHGRSLRYRHATHRPRQGDITRLDVTRS
jgi:hypothetical protein